MTSLVIERFGGISPRYDAFALPPFGAQVAEDTRLHAGVLKGFRQPLGLTPAVNVDAGTLAILYDTGADVWYSWVEDVDIVLGPVADTAAARRYYYSGDGLPKKTDSALGDTGASGTYPRSWLNLKVPAPATAPTVAGNGAGTGTEEDHVYAITYVSTFSGIQEESAPCAPVTFAAWQPGDTITLTRTDTPPTAGYNITAWRIYRSNGSSYFFVAEVAIGTNTYDDIKLNDALAEAISTTDFDTPPDDLTCLTSMPNGILAGISGNELCFCEPYQPHAWPVKYRIPIADIPVALAAVGQGLYVATEGRPALVTGLHPDSMTTEWAPVYAPCLSKRSMTTDGNGAMYATYNGVAYVTGVLVSNMSQDMMTQEEWVEYAPNTMLGAFYDGRLYLWYYVSPTDKGALQFDKVVPDAPLTLSNTHTTAAHTVAVSGKLFLVEDDEIKEDNADLTSTRTPYFWKSKLFITPRPTNFAFGQVISDNAISDAADEYAAKVAANEVLEAAGAWEASFNDVEMNQHPVNGSAMFTNLSSDSQEYVTLRIYAGGVLKIEKAINTDTPFRLPSGFKETHWEIEVIGTRPVRRIALANSMEELKAQ